MKFNSWGMAVLAASVVLGAALSASGQTVVSVQYTGGYSTTWSNSSGEYGAGIYTAQINGGPSASGIICDDFNDEITSGETWNANSYQVSTLVSSGNLGNTLFGKSIGATGYAEVATLVSMMFGGVTTYGNITGITQAELSSAIWDITAAGGITGLDSKATALVSAVEKAFNGNLTAATAYLASLTNLWILTPTPQGPGQAQEMWTAPEGGAALMYLLLAAIFCGAAFFFRNPEQVGGLTTGDKTR